VVCNGNGGARHMRCEEARVSQRQTDKMSGTIKKLD
jgi:hypothetical protein